MATARSQPQADDEALERTDEDDQDTGVIEIEVPEEEDEGDPPGDPESQRPSRDERRRNRFREAQEAAEQAREETRRVNEALAQEQRLRQQMENRLAALESGGGQPRGQPPAERDPAKEQREIIRLRMDAVRNEYAALPEDQRASRHAEFQGRMDALEDNLDEVRARAAAPQIDVNDVVQRTRMADLLERNADIVRDPQLRQEAVQEYQKQVQLGRQGSMMLAEESLQIIRQRHGLSGGRNSRAAARTSGVSGRRSSGAGRPNGRDTETLTAADRRLARAVYPGLSDREAQPRYVKEIKRNDALDDD